MFDDQSVNRISQTVRRVERMPQRPAQLQRLGLPSDSGTSTGGTGSGSPGDMTGLTTCASELFQAGCAICPCTADPWILQFTPFGCYDLYGDAFPFSSNVPLFYSAANSTSSVCTWLSGVYQGAQYAWRWSLAATSTNPPYNTNIPAVVTLFRSGAPVLTWSAAQFCCGCETCFAAQCQNAFPLPCPNWPKEVCVVPGNWSNGATVSGSGYGGCCPGVQYSTATAWVTDALSNLFPEPQSILLGQSGDGFNCFWSGVFPIPGDPIGATFSLHFAPCDGYLYLDLNTVQYGNQIALGWRIPALSFNPTGNNALTLYRNSGWTGSPPTTANVYPVPTLTDQNGNVVLGANGQPVLFPAHTQCYLGTTEGPPVQCCYTIKRDWITPGSTNITIGGDNWSVIASSANSTTCPDPSALPASVMAQIVALLTAYANGTGPNPDGTVICFSQNTAPPSGSGSGGSGGGGFGGGS